MYLHSMTCKKKKKKEVDAILEGAIGNVWNLVVDIQKLAPMDTTLTWPMQNFVRVDPPCLISLVFLFRYV